MANNGNGLAARQNTDRALLIRSAFEGYYRRVQRIRAVEFFFVVLLPIVLTVLAANFHGWDLIAAWSGVFLLVADSAVLYPLQRRAQHYGAQVQERFECLVLAIPESRARLLEAPEIEEISTLGKRTKGSIPTERMRDWYPVIFDELPLDIARLACMRASSVWDGGLRLWYIWLIGVTGAAILAGVTLAAGLAGTTVRDGLIRIALPLLPAVVWAIREMFDHWDAKETNASLRAAICSAWNAALYEPLGSERAMRLAMDLQSGLFVKRAGTPPVPNLVYGFLRGRFEKEMNESADELVRQYNDAVGAA